eukprot:SAG11_NODE_1797_length_4246_cov_2.922354_2_plen_130_part_00
MSTLVFSHSAEEHKRDVERLLIRRRRRPARHLYNVVIPVGQNPTGTRLRAARYRQVYALACKHDLLIIEDDAYFYEQHRANTCHRAAVAAARCPGSSSGAASSRWTLRSGCCGSTASPRRWRLTSALAG